MKPQKKQGAPRRYSILRQLTLTLLTVYILLFGLMLMNDIFAVQVAREEICNGLYDTLNIFGNQISTELSSADIYLAGKASDSSAANRRIIEENGQDSEFFSAINREKTDMQKAVYTMDMIHGLFLFPTTNKLFISTAKEAGSQVIPELRDMTREAFESGQLDFFPLRKWFPIYADGKHYLIRYFRMGQSYVGAWTDFSSLLFLVENHQKLVDQALLVFENRTAYNSSSQKSALAPDAAGSLNGYTMLKAERDYLTIATPARFTLDGYITMLVPDENISSQLLQNYFLMSVIGIVFLLPFLVVFYMLRRYVKRPIAQLEHSIESLRSGDFGTRIPADYECEEFSQVNTAFNDMVERIQDLKINVYEEQLLQQNMEMKFLKSQVAPHFLINCLNGIYHMAGAGETEYIQKMSVSLGSHLRYALAERPTVPLSQELEMAQNYIELSKLRFPGCIESYFSIDGQTKDAVALAMIVLTFVENTIKYSVVMGEVVQIHVETEYLEKEEKPFVRVRVWDTGEGWPPEVLKRLNYGKLYATEDGSKIGLRNIVRRGLLAYGDNYRILFSNHPGAGAQIEMEFPYETYQEPPDKNSEKESGQES